jgi:hypothetical protein
VDIDTIATVFAWGVLAVSVVAFVLALIPLCRWIRRIRNTDFSK